MGSGSISTKAWANAPVRQRAPIIEQLAAELQKTGGSVSGTAHGTVFKEGSSEPWDMSNEWRGRELTNYSWRKTQWSRTIAVRFYVELTSQSGRLHAFSLHLKPPLTDEEIVQMAETYMMVLNLRRQE